MKEITVAVTRLIDILTDNLTEHKHTYEQAHAIYRTRLLEYLAECHKKITDAMTKLSADIYVPMPDFGRPPTPPQSHTDDYQQAIAMLDMCEQRTITITHEDFTRYVMDDWDWKPHWKLTTLSYLDHK